MINQSRILLVSLILSIIFITNLAFAQSVSNKALSNTEYSQLLLDKYQQMKHADKSLNKVKTDRSKNNMTMLLLEAKKNWDRLTDAAKAVFNAQVARPSLTKTYEETTKNYFRFYYNDSGTDAVVATDANTNGVPDYVETMAAAFTKTLDTYDASGYSRPPIDASDNGRYCVYLSNTEAGDYVYGYSAGEYTIGDNPLTTLVEKASTTSYMVMRNDYTGFGDTKIALEVTCAHEFFHAVQFGYGYANMTGFLMEMCSTWAEDIVFPTDDDNFQYLPLIFDSPDWSVDYIDDEAIDANFGGHWYSAWIFMRYMSDHYGVDVPKLVFENSINNFESKAIDNVLVTKGTTLVNVIKDYNVALGLLTSSSTAPMSNYSFARGDDYRTLTKTGAGPFVVAYEKTLTFNGTAVSYASTSGNSRLMRASADFIKIVPSANFNITLTPTVASSNFAARLLKLNSYTNPTTLAVADAVPSGANYVISVTDQASYGQYVLVVYNTKYSTGASGRDASSMQYSINIAGGVASALNLSSPVGGESFVPASVQNITWSTATVTSLNIELSTDNGATWSMVSAGVPASPATYAWTVPSTVSNQCLIKITDVANAVNTSVSGSFKIAVPSLFAWEQVGAAGITGDIHGVDYASNDVVWISADNGDVARSVDGGKTFTSAGNAGDGAYSITAINDLTAVVATGPSATDGTIMRTTDGGATWTQVYTSTGAWFDVISKTDANNLWALSDPVSTTSFLIMKSSDGGATWTEVTTAPVAPTNCYGSNNCFYQIGNAIWFGVGAGDLTTASNFVFKSSNGVDGPWTSTTTTSNLVGSLAFSSATGNGLAGFWVASNLINKSANGGSTWAAQAHTMGLMHGLEFVQGTSTAYAATSTGLYKSADNGVTWSVELLPSTVTTEPFFVRMAPNGTDGLIVGGAGLVLRKTGNASPSFLTLTAPAGGEKLSVGSVKNITWTNSGVENIDINLSIDNGATWSSIASSVSAALGTYAWTVPNTPVPAARIKITSRADATLTYISGSFEIAAVVPGQTVLTEDFVKVVANAIGTPGSTDLSATLDTYTAKAGWTGAKIYSAGGTVKLGSSSAQGYIVTPVLDLSTSGGSANVKFDVQLYGTDANKTIQVLLSTDGGTTYAQVGSDIIISATMTTQTVGFTNGAATSKVKIAAKGVGANRFYLDNIVVGTGGASAVSDDNNTKRPVGFALEQNYPNPFNPSTTISFAVPIASHVNMTIYNQLGQKVAELVNGEINAGFHSVQWNAGNMASGIYFCSIKAGSFSSVKKLILMK